MKAYVIKNNINLYWFGENAFFNIYDDSFGPFDKGVIMFDSEDLAEVAINRNKFYDCTIVPITICEGDLEEENRVLKKALELMAEGWCIMDNPENPKDVIKHYLEKAKESEKDERD